MEHNKKRKNRLSSNVSDSDPTECASDLDTGQDGGDECETDDPLEIDYIDTASIQEVVDPAPINTGSCSYHPVQEAVSPSRARQRRSSGAPLKRQPSLEPDDATQASNCRTSSRRRKRLTRTRKCSVREGRDGSAGDGSVGVPGGSRDSSGRRAKQEQQLQDDRGTRSVGGTPVSLRRNKQHKGSKG